MGGMAKSGRARAVSAPVTAAENRYARHPIVRACRRWPWRGADFARARVATSVRVQPARFRAMAMGKLGPNTEIGPRGGSRTKAAATQNLPIAAPGSLGGRKALGTTLGGRDLSPIVCGHFECSLREVPAGRVVHGSRA